MNTRPTALDAYLQRLPMIRDEVTTITTPGETVGVIVTERGVVERPYSTTLKGLFT